MEFQIKNNPIEGRHKLPELFQEIISVDSQILEMKKESLVSIKAIKQMNEVRRGLSQAAEKYVQRQRSGQ